METVLQSKRNIDKSLELQNDPKWKDRLGTKEEPEAAHTYQAEPTLKSFRKGR